MPPVLIKKERRHENILDNITTNMCKHYSHGAEKHGASSGQSIARHIESQLDVYGRHDI